MAWDYVKRFFGYVWNGDTPGSFVLNILFAFLIIRYVVYPVLGFMLGTSFPIVAVVSGSMEHDGSFDDWWSSECCANALCTEKAPQSAFYASKGLDKEFFLGYPFKNGFDKGDIMVLYSPKNVIVGDIIVFSGNHRAEPIIHRVVNINDTVFQTKGDHNCGVAEFEKEIKKEQIHGKAVLRVPYVGYIKIVFVELLALLGIGEGI